MEIKDMTDTELVEAVSKEILESGRASSGMSHGMM